MPPPRGVLSSPPFSFHAKRERAAGAVQERTRQGHGSPMPYMKRERAPGPPQSWVGALPASSVNHLALHFGYAARGCGGGRVHRFKAPPRFGESGARRAFTELNSAARFPASRPSSKGRRGPPLRRGEGPRTGHPPKRSRGGSGARQRRECGATRRDPPVWGDRGSQILGAPAKRDVLWGITPVAFGDFWPDKSRAPRPRPVGGNLRTLCGFE